MHRVRDQPFHLLPPIAHLLLRIVIMHVLDHPDDADLAQIVRRGHEVALGEMGRDACDDNVRPDGVMGRVRGQQRRENLATW